MRPNEARRLLASGASQRHAGDYDAAFPRLNESLSLYRADDDRTGEYAAASANLSRAMDLCEGSESTLIKANALHFGGVVQQLTGKYAKAVDRLTTSLEIYRDLANPLGQANALVNLGIVHCELGDLSLATTNISESLRLSRAIPYSVGEADRLRELDVVRHISVDVPGAIDVLDQAVGDRGVPAPLRVVGELRGAGRR